MVKAITFSAVVVLMVGTAAFGAVQIVSNTNYFLNHFDTNLSVSGPGGTGSVTLGTDIGGIGGGLIQFGSTNSGGTTAGQCIQGNLSETGKVTTHDSGSMTVGQTLDAETVGLSIGTATVPVGQTQTMKSDGTASESQGLGVVGTQSEAKLTGGSATGTGENKFNLGLGQQAEGTGTKVSETAVIVGGQKATLQGDANATGTVVTNMAVLIGQIHSVK
jgi:hypothetical protein